MSDIPFKSWWSAIKIKCHVSVTRTWANTSQGMLFQTAIVFAQTVSCYLGGRLHRCTCSVGVAHWRDKFGHRLLGQKSTTKSWWSILSTLQFWVPPNKVYIKHLGCDPFSVWLRQPWHHVAVSQNCVWNVPRCSGHMERRGFVTGLVPDLWSVMKYRLYINKKLKK